MQAKKLCVLIAVIFSLSVVGYSQADQKTYRAIASELVDMAYPIDSYVDTAIAGAEMGIKGALEGDPKTQKSSQVLEQALLEVAEAMFRDTETIEKFRNMQTDLLMETYTESELRKLVKFYRTPIGKKVVKETPAMMLKGMKRGAAIGQSLGDSPKYREMLSDKINQLKAEGKLPKNF